MSQSPSYEDIQRVVETFYAKAMTHPQIGHFFAHIENVAEHEKRIVDFWWISMGGKLQQPPAIDMIGKHLPLGVSAADLDIWLSLFSETLQQQLPENLSSQWLDKVLVIADRLKQIVIDGRPMGVQIDDK